MVTPDQIREHYDSLALVYRTFWGDHIHHGFFVDGESPQQAQEKLIDHCCAALRLRGGETIFDAGCGHGATLLYLAQHFGCSGVGLTLSPKQARIAQHSALNSNLNRRVSFVVGDADDYPLPSASFDVVWAMESTEHFRDKHMFVRNAAHALRSSGKLLLAAWTGAMDKPRVQSVARAFLCPELWTAEQYRQAVAATGMKVAACEDLTASVVRTWEICRERAVLARAAVALLPRAARDFVEGIDIILDAYRSGDLSYTVIAAGK